MPLLEITEADVYYGAIHALKGVSLHVNEGEIVTLIGANGAGKTTTLSTVCGLMRPRRGGVQYRGRSILKTPAHKLVEMGLVMCPEGRGIFPNLSVEENLGLGAFTRRDKAGIARDLDHAFELFPILRERKRQPGATLSGGEQQMLAMARALMSRPKLLLLDEPSLGLAPLVVRTIFETVDRINKEGVTVLLVEQNANIALKHSARAYVIESGEIETEGESAKLRDDPRVKAAYLGEG